MDLEAGRHHEESPAEDVARLNGLLGAGISFELTLLGGAVGGGAVEWRHDGAATAAPGVASGVLILGDGEGARRAARRPVALSHRRRERLLALASCLAECAMDLGLGTGVYRRSAL